MKLNKEINALLLLKRSYKLIILSKYMLPINNNVDKGCFEKNLGSHTKGFKSVSQVN